MIKLVTLFASLALVGCATQPPVLVEASSAVKKFDLPQSGKSGVYIYSAFTKLTHDNLNRRVFIDGECVGRGNKDVFFYKELDASKTYEFSTESEISKNSINLKLEPGVNYYLQQYNEVSAATLLTAILSAPVFKSTIKRVPESKAKQDIEKLKQAENGFCD